MERIVKIIAILIFVICSLFSTSKVVYGVGEYCGEVRYYISFKDDCDKATAPACKAEQRDTKSARCTINSQGKCTAGYWWSGCYSVLDPQTGTYRCDYKENDSYVTVDCDVAGGGGGGGSYEPKRCNDGQYVSCGTDSEAIGQNKSFCSYYKTCNNYYFASTYNFPECKISSEGNPLYTCRTNCSCCDIGTERTCTLGASYTNTVSLYVGGGGDPVDSVYNQMMKDTCYRDGVKRRNDIVVSITLKRSYTKKDNTEWQDWEQSCRVQNCSCKAPPTPTLTPSKSACASGVRMT